MTAWPAYDPTHRALRVPPRLVAPAPPEGWTLGALGAPVFSIVVYGTPPPQGSKKPEGKFRKKTKAGTVVTIPRMVESAQDAIDAWRDAFDKACRLVLPRGWVPLDAPLIADMTFTLKKPVNAPNTRLTWPMRYPDLDKLARATGDALSLAKVYKDDARIVEYRTLAKRYPGEGPDALRKPGAVVRLWILPGAEVTR